MTTIMEKTLLAGECEPARLESLEATPHPNHRPRSRLSLAKLKKEKHLNERNIDLLHLDTSNLPIVHIIEPQPFKISFFPPSLFK